jgi:1-deoxy-D-xylulose-5-phosphate reductoisomerase
LLCAVYDEDKAKELELKIKDVPCKVVGGMEGLLEVAAIKESDMLVTAIVGMIGVMPTVTAIESKKDIALANKETLVTAGHIIIPMADAYGVKILPVDSEHSAIFQSLNGERHNEISKILLTCSGGPFRGYTKDQLKNVTRDDALNHPNWSMGAKITIDSSTLVNKGLEVMEAKWLFGVTYDKVQVVVHPQSVIHSMVEYEDGAIIAELGTPDMKLPIQYALTYPDRRFLPGERLDFGKMAGIYIEKPDRDTFKGLDIAGRASKIGGSMPTVMNEANEHAVAAFLAGKIKFLEIYDMIEYAMSQHTVIPDADLETILTTRDETDRLLKEKYGV